MKHGMTVYKYVQPEAEVLRLTLYPSPTAY